MRHYALIALIVSLSNVAQWMNPTCKAATVHQRAGHPVNCTLQDSEPPPPNSHPSDTICAQGGDLSMYRTWKIHEEIPATIPRGAKVGPSVPNSALRMGVPRMTVLIHVVDI